MDTKMLIRSLTLVAGLLAVQVGMAQAPAGAPAGATGLCKDGTYYTGASKQGACRGHQGVKDWYGAPASGGKTAATSGGSSAPATTSAAPATTSKSAPASATAPATTSAKSTSSGSSKSGTMTPAPGGGAGKVWLNTSTNVYHCPGSKYYGTTKAGAYMSEADAKAKGAHPDHNQPCK
jgi:Protein of unknown function (DUF3761)